MIKAIPFAVIALLATTAFAADETQGVAFTLDKSHSTVGFSVRHLGISKVRGSFDKFTTETMIDPATGHLTKVTGVVETASVNTNSEGRDKHLRSDDFFSSEKFPEMKLESRRIRWIGDRFIAHVSLTIRDKTHPVVFNGELLGRQEGTFWGKKQVRVGYEAEAKIDRQKFGLTFNKLAEGVSVVGNEVTLNLAMEFYKEVP